MKTTYNTSTKRNIIDYLEKIYPVSATVREISEKVDVNFSTAFRALANLEKEGKVIKILSDKDHQSLYGISVADHCGKGHLHLKCSNCGKIIHLECPEVDKIFDHIYKEHKFSIRYEDSILFGLCSECKKKLISKKKE